MNREEGNAHDKISQVKLATRSPKQRSIELVGVWFRTVPSDSEFSLCQFLFD